MNNKYQNGKEIARQRALDWQSEFPEKRMTWGEIAMWQRYFERLGKRFGLLTEFRENGIC